MRRKRYSQPVEPAKVQIQPDDIEILRQVYRHRLIDGDMLCKLFPNRGNQGLKRRLSKLKDGHYLGCLDNQSTIRREGGGSFSNIYVLDYRGAAELTPADAERPLMTKDEIRKRKAMSAGAIPHDLNTARFLVDIAAETRARGGYRLIYSDEIPQIGRDKWQVFRNSSQTIRSRIEWNGHFFHEEDAPGASPDSLFAIEDQSRPVGKNRRYTFLETDQATEVVVPSHDQQRSQRFWRQSSIIKKYVIYASIVHNKSINNRWNFDHFRVLFLTLTPSHVRLMQDAYSEFIANGPLRIQPRTFLFQDWETWTNRRPGEFVAQDTRGKEFSFF